MKNFLKKYKILIYIVIAILIFGGMALVMKSFLFPDDYKSIYGNRLNGIDDVKIDSNRKLAIKNGFATDDLISSIDVDIRGKIINIIINGKEGYTIESVKKSLEENLKIFSDKERAYYDIQFFVTNEVLKFNMIGYKNKSSDLIVWSEHSEVTNES